MLSYVKLIIFLLITGLYLCPAVNCAAADLDLSHGFGDIAWGTQVGTLTDLRQVSGTLDVIYYTRTENPYEIYGEDLGRVIYGFYQGGLFSAHMDIVGNEKFDGTLNGLIGEFGPPRVQYRVGHDVYIWDIEKVKVKLKHYDLQQLHKLAFYYTPRSQKLNEKQLSTMEETIFELQ